MLQTSRSGCIDGSLHQDRPLFMRGLTFCPRQSTCEALMNLLVLKADEIQTCIPELQRAQV